MINFFFPNNNNNSTPIRVEIGVSFNEYKQQFFRVIGADYSDFSVLKEFYFVFDKFSVVFDNCLEIKKGIVSDLLDNENKVLFDMPFHYDIGTLYQIKKSNWVVNVNALSDDCSYSNPSFSIINNLKHYTVRTEENEYWHILSSKFKIIEKNYRGGTHEFCEKVIDFFK